MIYTVTLNPAIDYVIHADKIKFGTVNRVSSESFHIGGKGINVSIILKELGVKSVALGFTAGFTGEAIEKELALMGIENDFVRLPKGNTRVNIKIKSAQETEINGQGADIDNDSLEEFFNRLGNVKNGDTVVIAGSVPKSLPKNIYERIIEKLSDRDIRIIADSEKELLLNILKYRPFLVKPNSQELGNIFGVQIKDFTDAEKYALKLQEMGARNVLVSMAGDGALLLDDNKKVYTCGVCKGTLKNSVGAGDSMLAGFTAGYAKGGEYALKLGTACGGATAFSEGLAERSLIFSLLEQL